MPGGSSWYGRAAGGEWLTHHIRTRVSAPAGGRSARRRLKPAYCVACSCRSCSHASTPSGLRKPHERAQVERIKPRQTLPSLPEGGLPPTSAERGGDKVAAGGWELGRRHRDVGLRGHRRCAGPKVGQDRLAPAARAAIAEARQRSAIPRGAPKRERSTRTSRPRAEMPSHVPPRTRSLPA